MHAGSLLSQFWESQCLFSGGEYFLSLSLSAYGVFTQLRGLLTRNMSLKGGGQEGYFQQNLCLKCSLRHTAGQVITKSCCRRLLGRPAVLRKGREPQRR